MLGQRVRVSVEVGVGVGGGQKKNERKKERKTTELAHVVCALAVPCCAVLGWDVLRG